jgi:hypothetical protein
MKPAGCRLVGLEVKVFCGYPVLFSLCAVACGVFPGTVCCGVYPPVDDGVAV